MHSVACVGTEAIEPLTGQVDKASVRDGFQFFEITDH